jgi:hypothetical protein
MVDLEQDAPPIETRGQEGEGFVKGVLIGLPLSLSLWLAIIALARMAI